MRMLHESELTQYGNCKASKTIAPHLYTTGGNTHQMQQHSGRWPIQGPVESVGAADVGTIPHAEPRGFR